MFNLQFFSVPFFFFTILFSDKEPESIDLYILQSGFSDCIIRSSSYVHLPWVVLHISSWVADWIRLSHPLGSCLNGGWQDHRKCIMCPCFSLPDLSSWCYSMPIYLFTEGCKIVVLYFYHIFFTYWLEYQSLIYYLNRQQYNSFRKGSIYS